MWAEHREIRFESSIEPDDVADFARVTLERLEHVIGFRGRWLLLDEARTCLVSLGMWDTPEACQSDATRLEAELHVLGALSGGAAAGTSLGVFEVVAHPPLRGLNAAGSPEHGSTDVEGADTDDSRPTD